MARDRAASDDVDSRSASEDRSPLTPNKAALLRGQKRPSPVRGGVCAAIGAAVHVAERLENGSYFTESVMATSCGWTAAATTTATGRRWWRQRRFGEEMRRPTLRRQMVMKLQESGEVVEMLTPGSLGPAGNSEDEQRSAVLESGARAVRDAVSDEAALGHFEDEAQLGEYALKDSSLSPC
ncbi:unnamed protein product [Phytophthora lilii]|uniref:Unnamed protein product n=1 Tax=Phytophthora lilii TaxID=2077276 RepID=A0A9W6TD54_9STRA|nr:unnamed protein product [Phytophthora lilii]